MCCNGDVLHYTVHHSDIARNFAVPEIRSACEGTLILQSLSLRPVFTVLLRSVAPIVLSCAAVTTALAQSPAAGSNWDHLKALPPATKLHVSADKGGATCKLVSVDDATLICGKHTFQRPDVKSVKLTRYGLSYGVGAAVGAGAGAGIGLAVIKDTIVENDKGKGAGIGLAIGAGIGALVAGPADLFKGPTVYRRQ
jgi:hypothetical protein